MRWLLRYVDVTPNDHTSIYYDNNADCHIANNLVLHEETKRVEMSFNFARELIESKEIATVKIDTIN